MPVKKTNKKPTPKKKQPYRMVVGTCKCCGALDFRIEKVDEGEKNK